MPKPPGMRQRRNKEKIVPLPAAPSSVGRATPVLPEREWHPRTLAWWETVWASPMSGQYLDADIEGLFRLAVLVDAYWCGDLRVAGEIRLQQQAYGLTPMDRLRLKWEIGKTEEAEKKRKPHERSLQVHDSRDILRGVK